MLAAIVDNRPEYAHTIVTGRVSALTVVEREVPTGKLGWFPTKIVTRVTLSNVAGLCTPSAPGFSGTFWTFGGRLPDGRRIRSEYQPDLEIGQTYAFLLREIEGDWFLAVGRRWTFRQLATGDYEGIGRISHTRQQLEKVCP